MKMKPKGLTVGSELVVVSNFSGIVYSVLALTMNFNGLQLGRWLTPDNSILKEFNIFPIVGLCLEMLDRDREIGDKIE